MKMKFLALTTLLSLSPLAQAAPGNTWKDHCPDLKECIHAYSTLTGEQYIYDKDIASLSLNITDQLPFTKENAELIFTNILFETNLSRVMIKPGVYNIMKLPDARSKDTPLMVCDQNTPPKLPKTYDLITLQYKFTYPTMAKTAENVIRSYSSLGSRIYALDFPGIIYITDAAKHLDKTYEMLKSLDVKPTQEHLEKSKKHDSKIKQVEKK